MQFRRRSSAHTPPRITESARLCRCHRWPRSRARGKYWCWIRIRATWCWGRCHEDKAMSAINLFNLLPAVYRTRDAQIASAQTLLTPAQQAQLAALLQMQAMQQTLSSDQLAELQQLQTLAARGPLESLLLVVSEQLNAV